MLTAIVPKLPMRNKTITKEFYLNCLEFKIVGDKDFDGYLMLEKDDLQLHFFEYKGLNPMVNYGQIYIRTTNIEAIYTNLIDKQCKIHPNGKLEVKPWRQKEFSLLDPDNNLLTFGESI